MDADDALLVSAARRRSTRPCPRARLLATVSVVDQVVVEDDVDGEVDEEVGHLLVPQLMASTSGC